MSSSLALRPPVRAAFAKLIDYAGLFPPAKLAVQPAVAQYIDARSSAYSWMLGRFIVPVSRTWELVATAENALIGRLALSVIADASPDPRQWFASIGTVLEGVAAMRETQNNVSVESLEIPLPPLMAARETYDAAIGQVGALVERTGLGAIPVYVELPRDARWRDELDGAMAAMKRARLNAKVRCGGVTPEAFPSVEQLAAFIAAAIGAGVAFKATAGLHHPVRHFNEAAGATMHGFLNLLSACVFGAEGGVATIERVLAEEDPSAFAFADQAFLWRELSATPEQIAAARKNVFVSYGSCSFDEPIDDLIAMHVLAKRA